MNIDELKNTIQSFSFEKCKEGNQGFTRLLIQLFGFTGHGKSSFINTCIYVWKDIAYRNWAKASDEYGAGTQERITYPLTENITIVDNRGCKSLDSYETGEIFAQLGNLLPLDKAVEWSPGFGLVENIVMAEKLIKISDFIVPVFVYSVKRGIEPEETGQLKELLIISRNMTGVYPLVVLTHKTAGNISSMEATFRNMGVERIFSFENYTQEDHMKTRGKHEEVLKFLLEVIKDAQFSVDQPRDPQIEMKVRKKFVINYVHEQEKQRDVQKQQIKEQQEKEDKKRQDEKLHAELLKRQKEQIKEQQKKEEKVQQDKEKHAELLKRQKEEKRERKKSEKQYQEDKRIQQEMLKKQMKRSLFSKLKQ